MEKPPPDCASEKAAWGSTKNFNQDVGTLVATV